MIENGLKIKLTDHYNASIVMWLDDDDLLDEIAEIFEANFDAEEDSDEENDEENEEES